MTPEAMKALIAPLRAAQYDWDTDKVKKVFAGLGAEDALFRLSEPFGEIQGSDAFVDQAYGDLLHAMPDLERRDWIVMAGDDEHGNQWLGCGGHYYGTFLGPWLDIPPTGHLAHFRFHEFYKLEDGKLTEFQAIWDIPELMIQANAWPLVPSLGKEFCIPAPATGDGLHIQNADDDQPLRTRQHIIDMLTGLKRHPREPAEAMEMEKFWHPKFNWYGPAGIGTGRGISGFRHWHQIPFLAGMPDRGQYLGEIIYHFFGEGEYAAVTGWPNMVQTLNAPGWLGLAPTGNKFSMKSLDFWRLENGLIRENWVLVDMIDMYSQQGVDVFARLREFNKARVPGRVAPLGLN